MKKKQTSADNSKNLERQPNLIIHHVRTTSGKPLIAVLGKRSQKGNAHLKDIKNALAKEI